MAATRTTKAGKKTSTSKGKAKSPTQAKSAPDGDLRAELRALRDAIALELGRAPARDARQTALYDGWRVALKDRLPRVRRRLEDLLRAERWRLDEKGHGTALEPSHWRRAIRDALTDVAVALAGARRQYETIGLRWRETMRLGAVRGRNAPVGTRKALDKQKKDAEKRLEDERARERKRYRETMTLVLDGWAGMREVLAAHLRTLQDLTARLQEAEERRLAALAAAAPPEVAGRARPVLEAARDRRLDGETILMDSPQQAGRWSTLLRRWNASRERAARALA